MNDIACALLLVFVLGFIVLMLRGFVSKEGFMDAMRCDVYAPCPHGTKCLNGFCAKTDPPPLVNPKPLPLLPGGEGYPYF